MKAAQSCLSLCDPMAYTVHGILQARIVEWVAFPSPGNLPSTGIEPRSPAMLRDPGSIPGSGRSPGERIAYPVFLGFPGDSEGKESIYNSGDMGLIPGLGRSPGGGPGNPLQYACLENPHGQRSLVGYSPWGHKKSDTTE